MNLSCTHTIVAAMCAVPVFAAEVAFYPFAEGNDGDSAVGVTLQNAVDASSLSGSAVRNSGDTATAVFLDDVPGRYLYTNSVWKSGAIYSTVPLKSVQISWETNAYSAITSATSVEFASLGAKLAELDAWTVEYFFKFDKFRCDRDGTPHGYLDNVMFGDDEKFGMCLQNVPSSGRFYSVRAHCGGVQSRHSSAQLSNDGADGKDISPGLWHHVAVTYDSSKRSFKTILDYTHSGLEQTCNSDSAPFDATAFSLGNGMTAARFAALRVTDRVLTAGEMLHASDIPPDGDTMDVRFHYTFETKTAGESLGTVANEVSWRALYGASGSGQYAYSIDGQEFISSGDGVVTPLTYTYSDASIGTRTMEGFASSVTDRTRTGLVLPGEDTMRANARCAFLAVGPKNSSGETFGKGPSFLMSDVDLLTSSDFTAEMYFRPDFDGWNAVLGSDAGNRYRASVFGIKGEFKSGVSALTHKYVWDLYLDMQTTNFAFNAVCGNQGNGFSTPSYFNLMKNAYLQKCNDGRMHHYAVVYRTADTGNDGKPTVRLYIDHEEITALTLDAPLVDFASSHRNIAFAVGNDLNDHPMQGWFDEIRYTARALDPEDFLRLQHRPTVGMKIIYR